MTFLKRNQSFSGILKCYLGYIISRTLLITQASYILVTWFFLQTLNSIPVPNKVRCTDKRISKQYQTQQGSYRSFQRLPLKSLLGLGICGSITIGISSALKQVWRCLNKNKKKEKKFYNLFCCFPEWKQLRQLLLQLSFCCNVALKVNLSSICPSAIKQICQGHFTNISNLFPVFLK